MRFPLLGERSIDFWEKSELPSLPEGVEEWHVIEISRTILLIKAARRVVQNFYRLNEIMGIPSKTLMEASLHKSLQSPDPKIWGEESEIWKLASNVYRKEGWTHGFPHPASMMAAYWSTIQMHERLTLDSQVLAEDLTLPGAYEDPEGAFSNVLKILGRKIGFFNPHEADDFVITAGNQGKDFLRTQVSTFSKVVAVISNSDLPSLTQNGLTLDVEGYKAKLNWPKYDSPQTLVFPNLLDKLEPIEPTKKKVKGNQFVPSLEDKVELTKRILDFMSFMDGSIFGYKKG